MLSTAHAKQASEWSGHRIRNRRRPGSVAKRTDNLQGITHIFCVERTRTTTLPTATIESGARVNERTSVDAFVHTQPRSSGLDSRRGGSNVKKVASSVAENCACGGAFVAALNTITNASPAVAVSIVGPLRLPIAKKETMDGAEGSVTNCVLAVGLTPPAPTDVTLHTKAVSGRRPVR